MAESTQTERALFERVLEVQSEERLRWLAEACGDDARLFERVSQLLRADADAGRFLGGTTPATTASMAPEPTAPTQPVPNRIGRYRIVQPLGEGGFGVVYWAEQTEPVRRAVALKLLKPGLDSRRIISRFEAERQHLALMDHPNIARVFDAGAAEDGRPYFVMELVRGKPLSRYCDQERLDVNARLELFITVCDALTHAHQKGVIHRDLKPSNVLVAATDGRAVAKVIDFGIAKATQAESGGAGDATRPFELLGTPSYMSPEQARFTHRDIDVRSDIYSLGVLLHELMIGQPPLDALELNALDLDAWRRRICEEDPLRPSKRLASRPVLSQNEIAQSRKTTPVALTSKLSGDLDWIILRCLEKDRERRYASAAALAADLRRHLADEPVEAAAPSAAYRARKFLRRHRFAVSAGALGLLTMAAATLVSLSLAWRATRAEQVAQRLLLREQRQLAEVEKLRAVAVEEAATARAVASFLNDDVLASADPGREPERELTLRAVLDRSSRRLTGALTRQPAVAAAIHETLARAYQGLALHETSARHFEAARGLLAESKGPAHQETLRLALEAAFAQHRSGDSSNALPRLELASAQLRKLLGRSDPLAVRAGHRLAWLYYGIGRIEDWHREAEAVYQDMQGVAQIADEDLLGVMYLVARKRGSRQGGQFEAGEQILLQAAELMRQRRGPEDPLRIRTRVYLAVYYHDHWRNTDAAESLFLEVLDWQRRVLGEAHASTLVTRRNLGLFYTRANRAPEAQRVYLEVLAFAPEDSAALAALLRLTAAVPLPPIATAISTLEWRAARTEPPPQWTTIEFDATSWPEPLAARSAPLWLRAAFDLPALPAQPLAIELAGATRGTVYLNGIAAGPMFSDADPAGHWLAAAPEAVRALRVGRNVISAHVIELGPAGSPPWRASLAAFPAIPGRGEIAPSKSEALP